jgi:acetyl-CoA carboxylase carboxyl transferase subunit alpha
MAKDHNEWERPLRELEDGIAKLWELAKKEKDPAARERIEARARDFETRRDNFVEVLYSNLGPWEQVLIARAARRPYTLDYVQAIFHNFTELQGDRNGYVDNAIVGGPAMLDHAPVMIVGHQKGRNVQERQFRNFGMAKPEGYRKAIRLFAMAERFRMPVISFVDTPAADPGVESEARGISEAIAAGMFKMFELTVPTVAIVIGEGGSGGAIGIAAANRVLMQEHAVYSVIPPEGCAAILWRAPERAADAAKALQLGAHSAKEFGLVDEVVAEPKGGAHRDWAEAAALVKEAIVRNLGELGAICPEQLREDRYQKFRIMGAFEEIL